MITCTQCDARFEFDPALGVPCAMCMAAKGEYCTVARGTVLRGPSHAVRQRAAIRVGDLKSCPGGTPQSGRCHYFDYEFPYAGRRVDPARPRPKRRRVVQLDMLSEASEGGTHAHA